MGKKSNKKNQQSNTTDNNIIHKSQPTPPSSQSSQTTLVNGNSTASDNGKKQHDKGIEPPVFKNNNNGKVKKSTTNTNTNSMEKPPNTPKKPVKSKKSSKSNFLNFYFLVNFFTWKKILLIYVIGVTFGCSEKKREECSELGEWFCFNGLSQYILKNEWFKRYVEPGVITLNANAVLYTTKARGVIYPYYETHAKPRVDVYIEKSRPYLEPVKSWTTENVYSPAKDNLHKLFVKIGTLYNQHAKEHVNKYYYIAKDLSTPYLIQVQGYALITYESSINFNNKKIQPFYQSEVKPRLIRSKNEVVKFYNHKMVPFANQCVEDLKNLVNNVIIPAYHDHAEPHILQLVKIVEELIEKIKQQYAELTNTDDKVAVEKDRKLKAEKAAAEKLKAEKAAAEKLKAEKAAAEKLKAEKAEAERKRKESEKVAAEKLKAEKTEAERKRKESEKAAAEKLKAEKAEAERKRKESEKAEAERKRKEAEKAEAEAAAIIATKKSIHETTKNLLPTLKQSLATLLKDYENDSIKVKTESENDINSKVSTFKTFCDDQTSKIKNVHDKEKIKQILINVNRRARETIADIEAFSNKLNKSDNQFHNHKSAQIEQTKSKIFEANDKKYVNDELTNFVQQEINIASTEVDQKFQKISTGDKATIEDKINSSREKIRALSKQVLEFGKEVRDTAKNIGNKQEPETNAKSEVESPQLLVQSPDLDLSTLKRRYDPILLKLKENYKKIGETADNKKEDEVKEDEEEEEDEEEDEEYEEDGEDEDEDEEDGEDIEEDENDTQETVTNEKESDSSNKEGKK